MTIKDFQVAAAEFIGTFMLAFIIGATKNSPAGSAAIGIGFGLVALVYITGNISGGQLNPAVSVGLVVRGKLKMFEATYCIITQFIAATCAGMVCYAIYDEHWENVGYPAVNNTDRRDAAFVAEFLQTFALVTVVLCTATTKAQSNNSYFGLAIGFVVLSGALVLGNTTGACFNPAIAMLAVINGSFEDLWVFIAAPTLGGIAAGLIFRVLNPSEVASDDVVMATFHTITSTGHHNPDGNLTRMAAMLLMEFVGTFFLAYTVALTANVPAGGIAGMIAVGAILVSMVYAGGAISGGHYNPCVTLGVYLRGLLEETPLMTLRDAVLYIAIQIAAAFCAGGVASYINDGLSNIASPQIGHGHTQTAALVAELIFAYVLVFGALCTATNKAVTGNSYVGMAVGFTVLSGGITVANISGGVFNPAVGIALPALTDRHADDIWVYVVGDLLGGALAAGAYAFVVAAGRKDAGGGMDDVSRPLFDDGVGEHKI